jgi:uncharacterized protein YecT (DUF1311 family)
MRTIILLLGLIALSGAIARSEPANQKRTVLGSPDGTFELQEVVPQNDDQDTQIFVVSKAKPDERQLLTTLPSLWIPRWYSSPDSKWLAAPTKEVHEVGNMQLFRRINGLKFEKIPNFSDRAWGSLSAKRKYTKGEEGIIDFVSWSPDNARLLIALRGPVHGDSENDKPWFVDWSVYFNLQTLKFEYTAYLDRWDPQVFKSPSADDYDDRMALAPVSAEPLLDTVLEEDWKRRQVEADRALNEMYHRALAKLNSEEAARLRSEEISWIKQRDRIADEFAKQGTPPNPVLRRLQALVDATNARTADLKERWTQADDN